MGRLRSASRDTVNLLSSFEVWLTREAEYPLAALVVVVAFSSLARSFGGRSFIPHLFFVCLFCFVVSGDQLAHADSTF